MRIRSIKPEFWRSDDISALDRDDRLLFIGLWSYVDDNGVGRDKLADIAADLFAHDLEQDPRETFARVSRGLLNLAERGLITRYSAVGGGYLCVTGWTEHQRIDKPGKPRYPGPEEAFATSSRDSRETLAPGTGEQGNRGTVSLAACRRRQFIVRRVLHGVSTEGRQGGGPQGVREGREESQPQADCRGCAHVRC